MLMHIEPVLVIVTERKRINIIQVWGIVVGLGGLQNLF